MMGKMGPINKLSEVLVLLAESDTGPALAAFGDVVSALLDRATSVELDDLLEAVRRLKRVVARLRRLPLVPPEYRAGLGILQILLAGAAELIEMSAAPTGT